jgi:hypothetical protein
MKKQVGMDVLYVLTDFIFANSTEAERNTIFKETARGRKEDKNLIDNDRKLYCDKKFCKKVFKKIQKML